MKFYLSLLLLVTILNVQAQKYFEGSITYHYKVKFLTEKDSLLNKSMITKYGEEVERLITPPSKEIHFFKKDSLLIEEYFAQEKSPHLIRFATPREYKELNMNSGTYRNRKDYTISKYKNFKKYKRIKEEDEVICGFKCKAWKVITNRGWKKIWLADIAENLPELKELVVIYDRKLVLKEEVKFNKKNIKTKYAIEIKDLPSTSFASIIKKNTSVDLKSKYEAISKNENIKEQTLKEGELAPNIFFRQVYINELGSLHEITSKSNYTMIEFWGSWCMPCLAATPKIKNLRDKFSESELQILSFNTRDKIEEKVKTLIEKKEMNWKHAYSTQKIINIFNGPKRFPHAVLIDKNNKIVLIGNPHEILEKVEKIVSGEFSVEGN